MNSKGTIYCFIILNTKGKRGGMWSQLLKYKHILQFKVDLN